MEPADLITTDRIACEIAAASKKRVLEHLSALIGSAQPSLSQAEIFDALIARERLGSTGLGHGVAIPHGRVKSSEQTVGAFLKLNQGIDYDAVDQQPVDLLFALLVPEHSTDEHLQLLSILAEMFSDKELLQQIRSAPDIETIYRLIRNWHPAE